MPVGNMHTRCFWMTNPRLLEAVYALCITLCIAAAPVAAREIEAAAQQPSTATAEGG